MAEDFLNHDVARVFLQARYLDVVDLTYERDDWSHEDETAAVAIAALAFVGRLDEAKTVLSLALKSKTIDIHQRIFASFYLATSLTRHGYYAEARKLLSANFWLRHQIRGPKTILTHRSEFFISQGFAFFRFVGGHYHQADRHTKRAIEYAILAKFPYGRVLALDVQGHCLHHLGLHRESLHILDDAMRHAHKLGLSSLADNIMLQRELFITRFSVDLSPSRKRLEDLTKQVRFQNSYSQSVLFLELARIALMQGHIQHAKSLLVESSELNHVRGDRRLRIQHNLKQALADDMSGDQAGAMLLLKHVLEHIDPQMDIVFKIHALGHLQRLESQTNSSTPELEARRDEIEVLGLRSGRYLARRIALRSYPPPNLPSSQIFDSQDLFGLTLDRISQKDVSQLKYLCEQGSPGIAARAFGMSVGHPQYLAIFAETQEFLIAHHGEISYQPLPLTDLMVEVLKVIASGQGSLESLATKVWKARDYHPLKHDPKIYRVLSKLRGTLGAAANWIKTTTAGYVLAADVAILIIQTNGTLVALSLSQKSRALSTIPAEMPLTERIYSYITEKNKVTNRDIVAQFRISPVTSARELAKLVKDRRLQRMGAGRSTTYICR